MMLLAGEGSTWPAIFEGVFSVGYKLLTCYCCKFLQKEVPFRSLDPLLRIAKRAAKALRREHPLGPEALGRHLLEGYLRAF